MERPEAHHRRQPGHGDGRVAGERPHADGAGDGVRLIVFLLVSLPLLLASAVCLSVTVTASLGFAVASGQLNSPESLFRRAEEGAR